MQGIGARRRHRKARAGWHPITAEAEHWACATSAADVLPSGSPRTWTLMPRLGHGHVQPARRRLVDTDGSSARSAMVDMDGLSVSDLRASADHLRAVLDAIDSGTLEASGRQRAFIAGALLALELLLCKDETRGQTPEVPASKMP